MGLLFFFDNFLQSFINFTRFRQFRSNRLDQGPAGKLYSLGMTNFLQKRSFLSILGGKCRTAFTIAMIDRVPFGHLNLKFYSSMEDDYKHYINVQRWSFTHF